jgi:hypothetical protein
MYHGYYLGGSNYAKLEAANNPDFSYALGSLDGNITGSYEGNYGEIWNIEHRIHAEDLLLSAGSGGGGSMNPTPTEQFGGEPPSPATNPTPSNGELDVRLVLPQLDWSAG